MKIKLISFFLLFLLCSFIYNQVTSDKEVLIEWSKDRKLTWKDFIGNVDSIQIKNNNIVAITTAKIRINRMYIDDTVIISVKNFFNCKKSWTIYDNNAYILKHEQNHFDISEIQAREMRKYLSKFKVGSFIELPAINRELKKYLNNLDSLQDQYDAQTDFGRDTLQQKIWNKKIVDMLQDLNNYQQSRFNFRVAK